jgi:hypothetical protein
MSTWASELLTIYNALDEDRQQQLADEAQRLLEDQRAATA